MICSQRTQEEIEDADTAADPARNPGGGFLTW